jgi:hypothetical protein
MIRRLVALVAGVIILGMAVIMALPVVVGMVLIYLWMMLLGAIIAGLGLLLGWLPDWLAKTPQPRKTAPDKMQVRKLKWLILLLFV